MGPASLNIDSPDYALPSLSSEGNMDSAKIGAALSSSSLPRPSLFQPFPQPPSSTPSLPPPLLPEIAPASVPELQPRQPAPYSMTQGAGESEEKEAAEVEVEEVHCPWCNAAFPAGGTDLESHVEQHLAQVLSYSANMLDCKTYPGARLPGVWKDV